MVRCQASRNMAKKVFFGQVLSHELPDLGPGRVLHESVRAFDGLEGSHPPKTHGSVVNWGTGNPAIDDRRTSCSMICLSVRAGKPLAITTLLWNQPLVSVCKMKRIIFLNRFFFPDHSATSQLLSDLAFHLASAGRDVHVVASRQLYEDPRAELPPEEIVAGVCIHRLATAQFGRSALPGRSIDYLSFYRSLWRFVPGLANPGDILVAKTDPPLLSVLAMWLAKRRGTHLVNWLQDLYPEVAMKLGVRFLHGPVGYGLTNLRDRSLRAAAANIVVGQRMAEQLHSRGIDPQRISIIP